MKRKTNQDNLFVEQFMTKQGKLACAVLCDGMGGLQHGELASRAIVSAFRQWTQDSLHRLSGELPEDQEIRRQWTELIAEQNERIRAYGQGQGCLVGSTVTAVLLTETRYYILNIGDSRAYELAAEVRQLTLDHTVLADEIRLGNIDPEQAESFPMKNVLTKCVGVAPQVSPDFFFGETRTDAVYMICSDGFRHCITEAEMRNTLLPRSEEVISWLKDANEKLIRLNRERGETDNISVITIYAK